MSGDLAGRIMESMRRENPRIERTAMLLPAQSAVTALQFERIIREALLDDTSGEPPGAIKPVTQSAYAQRRMPLTAGAVPPYDTEST